MTIFQDTTDFSRGEVDPAMYSRQDADFYATAAKKISNFFPDRVGGAFKRNGLNISYFSNFLTTPDTEDADYSFDPYFIIGGNGRLSRVITISDMINPEDGTAASSTVSSAMTFDSRSVTIKHIELDGVEYAVIFEQLVAYRDESGNDLPDGEPASALAISVIARNRFGVFDTTSLITERDFAPGSEVSKTYFFGTQSGGSGGRDGTFGVPDAAYHREQGFDAVGYTPPMPQLIRVSTAGPAAFVATGRMRVLRIFKAAANVVDIELVQFYEELVGQVTVENGSANVTGENTIFEDQVSAGDLLDIEGEIVEVDTVTSQTALTLTANWTGLSVTTRAAVQNDAPFGGGAGAAGQYPSQVSFFQNRLILASTRGKPTGIWASKANNPFWILPGNVDADSPIAQEVFLPEVTRFDWMTATNRLYIGSSNGEYAIGDPDSVLAPTNFTVSRIGTTGSNRTDVAVTDTQLVHIGRSNRRAFAVQFDFARQSFASNDITFFAPHLFDAAVVSTAYRPATRSDPTNRLFTVLDDGSVRVCAYSPDQNILGWSRLEFQGLSTTKFVDVMASHEDVFFVLRDPDVGGHAIMRMKDDGDPYTMLDFVSSAALTAGDVTLEASDWYAGLELALYDDADGTFAGLFTADANGDIDLTGSEFDNGEGSNVFFGVPFDAEIDLLPSATADARGSKINRKRRLVRVLIDLYQTDQAKVNDLDAVPNIPKPDDGYTGVYEKRFLGWGYRDDTKIEILGRDVGRVRSVTREISA